MAGGIIVFACNENPCSGCFTLLIFCLDIKYIQLLHVLLARPERYWLWAGQTFQQSCPQIILLLLLLLLASRPPRHCQHRALFVGPTYSFLVFTRLKLVLDKGYFNPTSHRSKQREFLRTTTLQGMYSCE